MSVFAAKCGKKQEKEKAFVNFEFTKSTSELRSPSDYFVFQLVLRSRTNI